MSHYLKEAGDFLLVWTVIGAVALIGALASAAFLAFTLAVSLFAPAIAIIASGGHLIGFLLAIPLGALSAYGMYIAVSVWWDLMFSESTGHWQ